MSVLVDTSVWVAHFRNADHDLIGLLESGEVLMHPMVLGELACGTPPERERTLADLNSLQPAYQATMAEVMALVDGQRLFGWGCGLVDMMLLASARLTPGAALWTLDRRLADLAAPLDVSYRPALH